MSKKLFFLISFVLVLSLAGNVLAYETMLWDNDLGTGDRLWDTGTNWTWTSGGEPKRAPIASDWVCIGEGDAWGDPCNRPIINADTNAVCDWLDIGGYYAPPIFEAGLTMTGGTLTCGTWFELGGYQPGNYRFDISGGTLNAPYIWVGYVSNSYATMNISDGNIITETSLSIGIEDTNYADVNMTGGDVNLGGWLEIGSFNTALGNGHLDLHGGTITTALLSMGGGGVGTMDLAGGTLIIEGDYRVPNGWLFDPLVDDPCDDDPPGYTGTIAILADRGLITAYNTQVGDIITDGNYPSVVGLRAAVTMDYDVTNPGQTTITAGADDPNLAWHPNPLFGSGGILPPDVLSWAAGENAASHDVYFGTSFTEVNEANTPLATQPLSDVNYPVSPEWNKTYYWRIDEVNDPTTWKGTVWNFATAKAWATNPRPTSGATGVSALSPVIKWDKGPVVADVNGHYVYFSTDFNDVNERDPSVRTVVSDPCFIPGTLELSTLYYWAVDEVNNLEDPNVWPSLVWNFTTIDHLIVDNFNSYAANEEIKAVWMDWGTIDTKAQIFRETTLVRDGNSMKFNYYNDALSGDKRKYSESEADASALGAGTDWTASGVKALVLYFLGVATNSAQPLYLAVSDGTNIGVVTYDDANGTQENFWHEWNIDLEDPCFIAGAVPGAVDMNNVLKVYLGVGIRGDVIGGGESGGGEGDVYFDDIELWPPRCVSEKLVADVTGDCITDYEDVEIMADDWLLSDGNATAAAPGFAPVAWYKFDEGTGTTALDSSVYGNDGNLVGGPDWVVGYDGNALEFDGLDDYVDINYIPELSLNDFTVSAWVNLTSEPGNSGVLGTRVDGEYTFDFKVHSDIIHGDIGDGTAWIDTAIDIRSNDTGTTGQGGDLVLHTWYMITYVIDNTNQRVRMYIDGDLKRTMAISGIPLLMKSGQRMWIGHTGAGTELMMGLIDDVRIYDKCLTTSEIMYLAAVAGDIYLPVLSPANITDPEEKFFRKVNFRDYAILADHWLEGTGPEGPILWPQ